VAICHQKPEKMRTPVSAERRTVPNQNAQITVSGLSQTQPARGGFTFEADEDGILFDFEALDRLGAGLGSPSPGGEGRGEDERFN
jgi:hypothetical protein